MKIELVGIVQKDYDLRRDGGPEFHGRELQCIVLDAVDAKLQGHTVTTIKISNDHALATVPLEVGKNYICYFDQKKKLDFLREDGKQ